LKETLEKKQQQFATAETDFASAETDLATAETDLATAEQEFDQVNEQNTTKVNEALVANTQYQEIEEQIGLAAQTLTAAKKAFIEAKAERKQKEDGEYALFMEQEQKRAALQSEKDKISAKKQAAVDKKSLIENDITLAQNLISDFATEKTTLDNTKQAIESKINQKITDVENANQDLVTQSLTVVTKKTELKAIAIIKAGYEQLRKTIKRDS